MFDMEDKLKFIKIDEYATEINFCDRKKLLEFIKINNFNRYLVVPLIRQGNFNYEKTLINRKINNEHHGWADQPPYICDPIVLFKNTIINEICVVYHINPENKKFEYIYDWCKKKDLKATIFNPYNDWIKLFEDYYFPYDNNMVVISRPNFEIKI